MTISIEIIGVEPACYRCKETKQNAEKAAAKLRAEGLDITIDKLDVMAKSTMDRFGVVRTPALVVNGSIKIMGKVPDPGVIERIVRKEL
jgi:Thioredoxin domain